MIREGTVFIIGAGASAPYGFPVGSGFRDDICLNFRSDIETFGMSSIDVVDILELTDEFIERFRKSQISIDKWLSLNRRFENIGKLAIVNSIVKHEKLEELFFEGKEDKCKSKNWFPVLFKEMVSGISKSEHFQIQLSKVAFITFNYDRLLEHLFYESFKNAFPEMRVDDVNRILSSLTIIHVYGAIDDPPWETNGYRYGKDYKFGYLNNARERIKIIGEETDYNSRREIIRMRNLIFQSAKRIFFLGFGYDPDNMSILNIPESLEVYGTAYELFKEEIDGIKARIRAGEGFIEPCDCTELLRKYFAGKNIN